MNKEKVLASISACICDIWSLTTSVLFHKGYKFGLSTEEAEAMSKLAKAGEILTRDKLSFWLLTPDEAIEALTAIDVAAEIIGGYDKNMLKACDAYKTYKKLAAKTIAMSYALKRIQKMGGN